MLASSVGEKLSSRFFHDILDAVVPRRFLGNKESLIRREEKCSSRKLLVAVVATYKDLKSSLLGHLVEWM